ncbi:hypothetical protein Ahu01nite_099480 [Winogradskya humida]|uniref:Uncharacterized protein n=1 Tax=Winogradskya humida TaxID=113566 RepID=A0ABQ4A7K2_9ACTN|nr:hypothetical protein Ahu01nite_099480 [Actinoplanes humidus]
MTDEGRHRCECSSQTRVRHARNVYPLSQSVPLTGGGFREVTHLLVVTELTGQKMAWFGEHPKSLRRPHSTTSLPASTVQEVAWIS